jgi:hypothetical protein
LVGLSVLLAGRTNLGGHTNQFDIVGQVVEILVILGLIGWGLHRNRRGAAEAPRLDLPPGLSDPA